MQRESEVDGEIEIYEEEDLLIVKPKSKKKEYMQEELGDRETEPKGLWRKHLKHGGK